MRKIRPNRRQFLRTAGMAAAGGAWACSGPSTPTPDRPGDTGPPDVPVDLKVRRDVSTLDPNGPEMQAYRAGVMAMRQRPDSNPVSWQAQAEIHLDQCPHGNWFFLPWHRAYLLYFEQVCREASGVPDFTLPYWNWTDNPQVPAAFWGSDNPLFQPGRTAGPSSTADPTLVGQPVIDSILAINDFETFASAAATQQRAFTGYGRLEGTPHNYVHGFVGGDMATFVSPLDPIFWLHHANIDRLWAEWNETHANSNDNSWLDFEFTGNFVEPNGTPVDVAVREMLSTYPLGYRYDTQPDQPSEALMLVSVGNVLATASAEFQGDAANRLFGRATLNADLRPDQQLMERIDALTSPREGARKRATLRLAIEGVQPPADSSTGVRVFINPSDLSPDTPTDDPHYVGTFTFFTHTEEGHEQHGRAPYLFDAGPTLRRLRNADLYQPDQPIRAELTTVSLRQDEVALTSANQAVAASGFSVAYVEHP